jgi:hypothetical protein
MYNTACNGGRILLLPGVRTLLCSLQVSLNHGQLTSNLQSSPKLASIALLMAEQTI